MYATRLALFLLTFGCDDGLQPVGNPDTFEDTGTMPEDTEDSAPVEVCTGTTPEPLDVYCDAASLGSGWSNAWLITASTPIGRVVVYEGHTATIRTEVRCGDGWVDVDGARLDDGGVRVLDAGLWTITGVEGTGSSFVVVSVGCG